MIEKDQGFDGLAIARADAPISQTPAPLKETLVLPRDFLSARVISMKRSQVIELMAQAAAKARAGGATATEIVSMLKTTGATPEEIKAAMPDLALTPRGVLTFK